MPSALHVFTSGSVNLEGSAGRTTKKKNESLGRGIKRKQCLLVLANKFENPNLGVRKGHSSG